MFRDREKALEQLQKQLMDEAETQDDLPREDADDTPVDVRAYNTDTADTDLDSYSQDVYHTPPRRSSLVLWLLLLTAAVLLILAWAMAKAGGLL